MITCKASQYEQARKEHPDEHIVCVDTNELHVPGYAPSIRISAFQKRRAVEDPESKTFEPSSD